MKTLIKDCYLLDRDARFGYRSAWNIAIDGQQIASITPEPPKGSFDHVINASRMLAIPGIINAHSHSPETLGRASHAPLPLEPWLFYMIFGLGHFSPRDHYLAAQIGAIETIRSGSTTILDHLTLPGGFKHEVFDAVMEAYRDIGIRARVAPILRDPSPEVVASPISKRFAPLVFSSDEDGLPIEPLPSTDEMIAMERAFFSKWHHAENGRLRGHVGPGGIQWSTIDFLHACNDLARELGDDVGVHTHLMETRVQDATVRQQHGMTAVAMLMKEGLLRKEWSLAHSIWLTDKDVARIAEVDAVPVHNPAANMRLGSGFSPIRKFLNAGCIPALGADGSMSSDHQNMFAIMHLAAQIHNCTFIPNDQWLSSHDVLEMATTGGARALLQVGEIGKLEPGYLADITLLDLDDVSLTPLNHACHHLAYTVPSSATHTVIVDGTVVFADGQFTQIDEKAILAEAREAAASKPFRQEYPPAALTEIDRLLTEQIKLCQSTGFEQD